MQISYEFLSMNYFDLLPKKKKKYVTYLSNKEK